MVNKGDMMFCAAIGDANEFHSSGTLIHRRVVLTARHIADDTLPKRVYFGDDSTNRKPGETFKVKTVITEVVPEFRKDSLLMLILDNRRTVWPMMNCCGS